MSEEPKSRAPYFLASLKTPDADKPRKLTDADFRAMRLTKSMITADPKKVQPKVREILRGYVASLPKMLSDGIGLTFIGVSGTGKTMAAGCLAKAVRSLRIPVYYSNALQFREDVKARALYDHSSEKTVKERARTVPFLILDDVRPTDIAGDAWFQSSDWESLIKTRYEERRPTVFVTSASLPELSTHRPVMDALLSSSILVEFEKQILRPDMRMLAEQLRKKGAQ